MDKVLEDHEFVLFRCLGHGQSQLRKTPVGLALNSGRYSMYLSKQADDVASTTKMDRVQGAHSSKPCRTKFRVFMPCFAMAWHDQVWIPTFPPVKVSLAC